MTHRSADGHMGQAPLVGPESGQDRLYSCLYDHLQYLSNGLAGKNVSEMTHFDVGWDVKP